MFTSQLKSLVDTAKKDYPSTLKFCMCCSAAFLSETITYPLDILKTRIQVYGELQSSSYPGVIKICSSVIRNEGLFKLWQGLSPALFRHIIYTGARMPIYEIIRQDIFHLPPASHFTVKSTKNSFSDKSHVIPKQKLSAMEKTSTELIQENKSNFVIQAAFTGVIAGSFAQFLASPIDLIKDGTLLHMCASITSGFVAAVLGTPADMIKTRMMNQRTTVSLSINGSGLLYAGVIDCFRKTVRNEGFSALYKGFFLIWARMVRRFIFIEIFLMVKVILTVTQCFI
ncbi:mitochondrial uncoupling protein, putative [Schistosoma mansoni]|uniref:mitochondrial uncoupling protein, putative n=1 Tax=Schistosoma mansoni TaxID=6183 RepID=UPI00022C854D|nr:mitochondrial uncoupling protein, putative [Schistosoma mansoni]|eukprot:XP_018645037.1 mitochondrial uncoupling protein, putative [Schistosoma mansoni]